MEAGMRKAAIAVGPPLYDDVQLARLLQREHLLTVIGTLRKNKPQIPLVLTQQGPEKTSMFAFQEKCTLVSYVPRKGKNVLVISTMHYDDNIDNSTGKPEIIIEHNKTI
ncbi:uncharacterized protein [Diabrotica undecimpunctata]|uniref:uncharacterized protein n=1 Tax=Diabrotica undecimpunctata TaxID=50387 RepID=UPI003B64285C